MLVEVNQGSRAERRGEEKERAREMARTRQKTKGRSETDVNADRKNENPSTVINCIVSRDVTSN